MEIKFAFRMNLTRNTYETALQERNLRKVS